jgi:uncharacterized lipoprotein
MLKLLSQLTALVGASVLLSGCFFGPQGYIHDRGKDYLKSQSEPSLKLPANMHAAKVTPALAMEPGPDFHSASAPSLVPPGQNNKQISAPAASQTVSQPLKATVGQGAAGFAVLKLSASYAQNWKVLIHALPTLGYQVIGSDKKTGVLEVMTPSAGNAISEIYQFKILDGTSGSIVSVLDQSGDNLPEADAKAILMKLQQKVGT